jgi:hypothetical protein
LSLPFAFGFDPTRRVLGSEVHGERIKDKGER